MESFIQQQFLFLQPRSKFEQHSTWLICNQLCVT